MINISGNFNLFFAFVCILVARRTVSAWKRILLCIYKTQFLGEFYFNRSVYWMFYFCYQQLFTWDMEKWLGKGTNKGCSWIKSLHVSMTSMSWWKAGCLYQLSPRERKNGNTWSALSFHYQHHTSAVGSWHCVTFQSVSGLQPFILCTFPAMSWIFCMSLLFAPCRALLSFNIFFKLWFNFSLCFSPAISVCSKSAY